MSEKTAKARDLIARETALCARREAGDRFVKERRQLLHALYKDRAVEVSRQLLFYLLNLAASQECSKCDEPLPKTADHFRGAVCESCARDMF